MKHELDRSLFLALLFLLGFGLVQVYSSSFIFAIESFDDGLFFVKKQATFIALAISVLFLVAYMPWRWAASLALFLWVAAFIGVGLTLVPGIGVKVGGAARWLNLGAGFRMEPSELLKYTFPVMLAFLCARDRTKSAPAVNLLLLVLAALPFAMLLMQPDFGSVVILSMVTMAVLFFRGLKWRYVISGLAVASVAFYFLVVRVDYRMARVTAFLDPWADPAQKGFQVIQSLLGFYSGGITGVGLGQGQGKLFFLPEAHTDFTLSVLGEELGFLGLICTFMLFGFVVFRGLQISAKAKGEFEQVVALGVTMMFAITVIINAGVAMGLLPTKGLGMPFLSYGGSALLSTCFGLGLLLNIDRLSREARAISFIKI